LNLLRHPRVNPVGNHVVEGAEALVQVANVQVPHFDVRQSKNRHDFLTGLDLQSREVNPHEPAPRQSAGHGNQV